MSSYEELKSEIASDVLSEIDLDEIVGRIDTSEIAGELCVEDIASYVEIDPADVNWEEIVGNVLMREYDMQTLVGDTLKLQEEVIDHLAYDVEALRETVRILDRKLSRPWWKFWG